MCRLRRIALTGQMEDFERPDLIAVGIFGIAADEYWSV